MDLDLHARILGVKTAIIDDRMIAARGARHLCGGIAARGARNLYGRIVVR